MNGDGYPSIAYSKSNNLQYARYDGIEWHITDIDQMYPYGWYRPRLSFTSDGLARIASASGSANTLALYSQLPGGDWERTDLYTAPYMSSFGVIDLCINKEDNPHIVAHNFGTSIEEMLYVYFDGSTWIIKDDFDSIPGGYLSLDNDDNPYIAYESDGGSNSSVCCTFYQLEQWWTVVVAGTDSYSGLAIANDADGLPHILWCVSGGLFPCSYMIHRDGW